MNSSKPRDSPKLSGWLTTAFASDGRVNLPQGHLCRHWVCGADESMDFKKKKKRDRRREEERWRERKKDRDRENLTSSGLKGF